MNKVRFDWASANGQISQVGEKQTGGHSRKGTQHCQRQEDREGLSRARHSAEFSTCMPYSRLMGSITVLTLQVRDQDSERAGSSRKVTEIVHKWWVLRFKGRFV